MRSLIPARSLLPRERDRGVASALLMATVIFGVTAGCVANVNAPGAGSGSGGGSGSGSVTGTGSGSGSASGGSGPVGGTTGVASGGGTGVVGSGGSTGGGLPGSGGAGAGGPSAACLQATPDSGASVLRRLSSLEYQLTVQDLFQLPTAPAVDTIAPDVARDGFRTVAGLQTMSAQYLRGYLDRAGILADELLADTARRPKVVGCTVGAAGCLKTFITRFGKLAYRRPMETTEVDTLVSQATTNAIDTTDQIRYAIQILLTSSHFLYRVELGAAAPAAPAALATLTPLELASRLSFALWGRAPTEALLDQAIAGALTTQDGLVAVATTMLGDARAQIFYEAFFRQWLGFETLRAPTTVVPGWSDALMPDISKETQQVLGDFAWGTKNFLDVLTTNQTRVTPALAKFYGLPAPAADGLLTFPADNVRANTGLLTHASLISAKSDGDQIALRGNWLRQTFLCKPLSVPASVADELGDLLVGLTRVQIVQKRNTETACKGCHAMIDPIGVGFAQFDQAGHYDPAVDIKQYGVTPGLPDAANPAFASIAELAGKLRQLPEVQSCLAKKVFLYANGRDPLAQDACALETASQSFAGNGQTFPALLKGLVTSPAFRLRRAALVTP